MQTYRATLRHATAFLLLAGTFLTPGERVAAQAVTTGQIVGTLLDAAGGRVADPSLTLSRGGVALTVVRGALDGSFRLPGLAPGQYALLAEQAGYQPVRLVDVPVTAGAVTTITLRLERRPPPIEGVEERPYEGLVSTGLATSIDGRWLDLIDRRREATDLGRDVTTVASSFGAEAGFAIAANGLGPASSQLVVDGLEEALLRHPGLPGEPAFAPIFARDGVVQASVRGFAPETDVPGTTGATLSLVSELGSGAPLVRPWIAASGASFGAAAVDNPGDSSATSLQAGIALGGPIKGDTAAWFLRMDYQQLQQPSAEPLAGADAALLEGIAAAAAPTAVGTLLRPLVRTYTGFSGQAGGVYRIGDAVRLTARLGAASWDEDAPALATSATSGAGTRVESRDASGSVGVDYTDPTVSSVTRIGFRNSSRDWRAASTPFTSLGVEGVAFGASTGLPGTFDESMIQAIELVTIPLERHEVRLGAMIARRGFTYDWLVDGSGGSAFGSLDDFLLGEGISVRTTARDAAREIALVETAIFADGVLRVSPTLDLEAGIRYQRERAPTDLTVPDSAFTAVFGVSNAMPVVSSASSFGPRVGFTLRPGAQGRTVVRVTAGFTPGHWDRAALAEVARHDGGVDVARTLGPVDWPASAGGNAARRMALFADDIRTPRSFALEGLLRHALPDGTTLSLSGGYRHADYLMRRDDLNRTASPLATASDLRPIWGDLQQVGALIAPTPGSNARFDEYDRVYRIGSSGFADHYEVTVAVVRALGAGLSIRGGYTWSRTEDNLVGQRSPDPADRLSPFGNAPGVATWDEGRSDLDIPHRLAATLAWRAPSGAVTMAARFRMRSGLPFTAGFPRGTDVNGDGSSANDPVATRAVPGLEALLRDAGCELGTSPYVPRNGCREDAVRALDLQAAVRLPFGGRGVMLTVDAFNLASAATGVIDRAAVLVDPDGSITTTAGGQVDLPLILNAGFGRLLARRNDPRTLRIGLRVEN